MIHVEPSRDHSHVGEVLHTSGQRARAGALIPKCSRQAVGSVGSESSQQMIPIIIQAWDEREGKAIDALLLLVAPKPTAGDLLFYCREGQGTMC